MDLLSTAYTSDEDADEPTTSGSVAAEITPVAPPPWKRPRWEPYPYPPPPPLPQAIPLSLPTNESPQLASLASGRYVSKRERALLAASRAPVDSASQLPPPAAAEFGSPVGPISDSNPRADILHSLRFQPKPGLSKILPLKHSVSLNGHTKAVNRVDWSSSHDNAGLVFSLRESNLASSSPSSTDAAEDADQLVAAAIGVAFCSLTTVTEQLAHRVSRTVYAVSLSHRVAQVPGQVAGTKMKE